MAESADATDLKVQFQLFEPIDKNYDFYHSCLNKLIKNRKENFHGECFQSQGKLLYYNYPEST